MQHRKIKSQQFDPGATRPSRRRLTGEVAWIAAIGAAGFTFFGSSFLGGCTSKDVQTETTIATMDELPENILAEVKKDPVLRLGYAVYSRNCVGCHGINGDGAGPAAEHFNIKPRDFTAGIFKFRSTPNGQLPLDKDLERTILQGLQGSPMPSFAFMPDRQRQAVIEFIKLYSTRWEDPSQAPNPVDLPATEPPDLLTRDRVLKGRFAYIAMGCQNCHGMTGRGNGPSAHSLKDDWGNSVKPYNYHQGAPKGGDRPLDVYRTFRTGVNPMPMYQADTLGLVTKDLKGSVFSRLHEEERKIIEPIVDSFASMSEFQTWQKESPEKAEEYANQRAWDLVAYTIWLREISKPARAAIWPEGSTQFGSTPEGAAVRADTEMMHSGQTNGNDTNRPDESSGDASAGKTNGG